MSKDFFCGSYTVKLDDKNRFVVPQNLRYQLVENGVLEFSIALSIGGCLAIYRKSDMDQIVERFRRKQHIGKFQKFFTLFFSTLVNTTCDKVGRVSIPGNLKSGVGINSDIVIAGALNKIEIWPKEIYERDLANFISGNSKGEMMDLIEEAFSTLRNDRDINDIEDSVEEMIKL